VLFIPLQNDETLEIPTTLAMVQAVNIALQQPVPAHDVTIFNSGKRQRGTWQGNAFQLVHVFNVNHARPQRSNSLEKGHGLNTHTAHADNEDTFHHAAAIKPALPVDVSRVRRAPEQREPDQVATRERHQSAGYLRQKR
jgi:hypothetical protein